MSIFANIKARLAPWKRQDAVRQEVPPWILKHEHLAPIKPVNIPQVPSNQHFNLAINGWATVKYQNPKDPLKIAFDELLQASQAFFDQPESYKEEFRTKLGTEEGWNFVEGEKEFITIRCLENTPDILKDAAAKYWAVAGGLLDSQVRRIAESLGLKAEDLSAYSTPCSKLLEKRTATMLRLFKYEGYDGTEPKTVAEQHRDLGLLSLVIGDTPGLEVWDVSTKCWCLIEKAYKTPAASVLVGRQLEILSNGRYSAGGHRVRSYPEPKSQQLPGQTESHNKFRYSVVFVLRAHSPVLVNTDNLTTDITGEFKKPVRDTTAMEMFKQIEGSHFNINAVVEEREKQRQKVAEMKRNLAVGATP